ncbi:RdgB/HAM1 family non-canonical purine NTP pyrophosphatase [Rivibacter subsaxonicus]|uniref:dITP/XTP pyrophosphatase n=1 Tax=Rivibacter subsaxonicus TaxID=457575 RepID=A0A4Q7W2K0_9BURK|nr:RdgB/HAM1 family non-canonical purine NTP pyrophosphatase [Rivibacter subsaxonicus]RZU02889.1 XTP/dITP diphosphohydrolase [Rivibacter subsaxonicus]
MKLVLASNNAKKLAELRTLFASLPLELVTQGALGIAEAEEPHLTFIENALAKARHAARASGLPAIADDSGLCVDALDGAPGVASAVFAPLPAPVDGNREQLRALQDAANNTLLLERLQGVSDRRARFVSVLVAVRHADDPEPLVAVGRWEAEILDAPRGSGGFGYDPLVWIASLHASVAELDAEVKNAMSHRARAAAQMFGLMRDGWSLVRGDGH